VEFLHFSFTFTILKKAGMNLTIGFQNSFLILTLPVSLAQATLTTLVMFFFIKKQVYGLFCVESIKIIASFCLIKP
jgi:hypothetical protein